MQHTGAVSEFHPWNLHNLMNQRHPNTFHTNNTQIQRRRYVTIEKGLTDWPLPRVCLIRHLLGEAHLQPPGERRRSGAGEHLRLAGPPSPMTSVVGPLPSLHFHLLPFQPQVWTTLSFQRLKTDFYPRWHRVFVLRSACTSQHSG